MKKIYLIKLIFSFIIFVSFSFGWLFGQTEQTPIRGKLYVDPACNNNCIENQDQIENALTRFLVECNVKVNIIFNSYECPMNSAPKAEINILGPEIKLPTGETSGLWYKQGDTDYLTLICNNCQTLFAQSSNEMVTEIENYYNFHYKYLYNVGNSCRIKRYLEIVKQKSNCNIDLGISTDCSEENTIQENDLPKYINLNGSYQNTEIFKTWDINRKAFIHNSNVYVGAIEEYAIHSTLKENRYIQGNNDFIKSNFDESLVLYRQHLKDGQKFYTFKVSESNYSKHYGVHFIGNDNQSDITDMMNSFRGFYGAFIAIKDIFDVSCKGDLSFRKPDHGTCNFDPEQEPSLTYKVVGKYKGKIGSGDLNGSEHIKRENVFGNGATEYVDIEGGNNESKTGSYASVKGMKVEGEYSNGIIDYAGLNIDDLQNAENASKEFYPNSSVLFIVTSEECNTLKTIDGKMTISELADKVAESIKMNNTNSPTTVYRIHIKDNKEIILDVYHNEIVDNKKTQDQLERFKDLRANELIALNNRPSSVIGLIGNGDPKDWKSYPYGVEGEMNFFRKYGVFTEIGTSIWDNQALPDKTWKSTKDYPIRIGPPVGGFTDAVIEEATGLLTIVKLGYSTLASNEEKSINLDSINAVDIVSGMLPEFNFDASAGNDVLWHDNTKACMQAVFMVGLPGGKSIDLVENVAKGASKAAGKLKFVKHLKLQTKAFKGKIANWAPDLQKKYLRHLDNITESNIAEAYIKRITEYPELSDLITKKLVVQNEGDLIKFVTKNGDEINVSKVIAAFPDVPNEAFYKSLNGKVGFLEKLDALSDTDFEDFFKDIADRVPDDKLAAWGAEFGRSPKNLDSWKKLRNKLYEATGYYGALAIDSKVLTAFTRFDDALINKIGTVRFDNFIKRTLEANPKCSICGANMGAAVMGNFDEILDNFHKVVTNRAAKGNGFVDKFDSFMAEAGASPLKAQGAALTLKKLVDEASWAEMTKGGYTLKRFEGYIPDIETKHELDVLFESASGKKRSIEMKNWSEAQAITGTTYDQFKAHITSGNEFIYYFSDASRGGMKAEFQNLYKNAVKLEELWNAKSEYFKKFKIQPNGPYISSWQQIKTLADEGKLINHELLNFIK